MLGGLTVKNGHCKIIALFTPFNHLTYHVLTLQVRGSI